MDRLRAAISQNREYPRQARRKKKQGTAKVSFTIDASGSISQVKLLSSSGVGVLDEAAMNAVRRVGKFEPFPDTFTEGSRKISVPVSFELR